MQHPVPPRHLVTVGALLIAGVALAGCTGSAGKSSSDVAAGQSARPAAGAPAESAQAGSAKSAASAPLQQRDIVRTATVELQTKQVDHAADLVVRIADTAGGRIDGDNRATSNRLRTAQIVARVPPAALDAVIRQVDGLGEETSRNVRGQDMTATKVDLDARTSALATSVTRLQQLMAHSGTIGDLVALESQLTQRESDLESMQAQRRALTDQVALATLTVDVTAPAASPPSRPAPGPTGFGAAFVAGWHAVVIAFRWLLAGLGYLLAVLAPLGAGALAVVQIRRRRRRRAPVAAN